MVDTSFLNLTPVLLAILGVFLSVLGYFIEPIGQVIQEPYTHFLKVVLGNFAGFFPP